jgi:hypothetical protein
MYSFKSKDILKGKFKKEALNVSIITRNGESRDDLILKMVFPINAGKLYLNRMNNVKVKYENCKNRIPKIILIGGFYPTKSKVIYPNFFSIYDYQSNSLHLNYYSLKIFDNSNLKNYARIGVKLIVVSKDELRGKVTDYYNLLLFGGDTVDGQPTKE